MKITGLAYLGNHKKNLELPIQEYIVIKTIIGLGDAWAVFIKQDMKIYRTG